jgi:hypothetical protein
MVAAVKSWMRMLAAVMLSMMLLTSTLLLHAVVRDDLRPGPQPGSVTDRARVDHNRQLAQVRGR